MKKKVIYDTPVFYPDLKNFKIHMHTKSGERFTFVLTGVCMRLPNRCRSSGYGSDDWYFHVKYHGKNHILHFCNDAGCGTIWTGAPVTEAEANNLLEFSHKEWMQMTGYELLTIRSIHPDSIEDARKIMKNTNSSGGPLSDAEIYGHY